ncbi:3595_t:CDS:1 [Racocetra persica]|uniref:3594_t:CDS:1 n=2 Tax=Racocetra persica TaxID=160502 RepID=A0ACA9LVX5_9GLOM|nr:3594_t:CDS:1 [Racocetra persica]CAG8549988.1 3595_t:CDS:1 [Racocetra persica]
MALPSQKTLNVADKPLSISNSVKSMEIPNIIPLTRIDKTLVIEILSIIATILSAIIAIVLYCLKKQTKRNASIDNKPNNQLPITQTPNLLFTQQLIEKELTPKQIARLADQLKANRAVNQTTKGNKRPNKPHIVRTGLPPPALTKPNRKY